MDIVNTGNREVLKPRKRQHQAKKALMAALKKGERCSKTQAYLRLMEAWDSMIDKAIDGDVQAMKLIVERLDGKVEDTQQVNLNVNVAFDEALEAGRQRAAVKARDVMGNHTIIEAQKEPEQQVQDTDHVHDSEQVGINQDG
jgi:hypothetical protein